MSKCKGCGAEIIWVKTFGGKSMPCDPEQIIYWAKPGGRAKIVTPNGEIYSAELQGDLNKATGVGYISHFATCPQANSFRRQGNDA